MLGSYAPESRVAEEVVDGERLWESACLGVVFLSDENGVTES